MLTALLPPTATPKLAVCRPRACASCLPNHPCASAWGSKPIRVGWRPPARGRALAVSQAPTGSVCVPLRSAATRPRPGARSPSWECENQIWEVPEWGPRNAGSGGDAAGPAGWLGAPEPRLLLRKPPMKDEAGAFPIRPLPAAGERRESGGPPHPCAPTHPAPSLVHTRVQGTCCRAAHSLRYMCASFMHAHPLCTPVPSAHTLLVQTQPFCTHAPTRQSSAGGGRSAEDMGTAHGSSCPGLGHRGGGRDAHMCMCVHMRVCTCAQGGAGVQGGWGRHGKRRAGEQPPPGPPWPPPQPRGPGAPGNTQACASHTG